MTASADIIDLLAGIAPGDPLTAVRDQRAQARENAQRSFTALLEPEDPGTFALAERYAVAAFVARLHGFDAATAFYDDLLGDEAPELVGVVAAAAAATATQGESTAGPRWTAREVDASASGSLGPRLAAALAHAHLLVFRPREARADALRALVAASWSADDIVSLSQLVAFLAFQLRLAWGLRVLAAAGPADAEVSALSTQGAIR